MVEAIQWYWNNIFIIGIIAIESSLCVALPSRRYALLKWLGFTGLLLAASALLTQSWKWDGDLIQRENLIANTFWRGILVLFSSLQLWQCFEIDFWNALFVSQVSAACQTAQFSIYKIIESLLLGTETQRSPGLLSIAINLVILAVASMVIYRLFGRGNRLAFKADRRNRYTILMAALLNLSEMLINGVLYTTDANANFGVAMIAMRCYSLLFNFVMLSLLYNLIIRRNVEKEQDMLQSIMRMRESQYTFSRELMNTINIKSHDLKKQIRYLREEHSDRAKCLTEIEETINAYDATIHTDNPALSAILTEKSLLCMESQIPFSFTGQGAELDFMRGIDVYTLFANLLDNAIEASLLLEPEKRNIQLAITDRFQFLSIHCENSFSGRLNEQDGVLDTIKSDADNHGFGYRSMEEIVSRYEGSISHRAEDHTFTVNILLPRPEK